MVEFLGLPIAHSETDLRRALVHRLGQFLRELGRDFTFIREEYPIQVGTRDTVLGTDGRAAGDGQTIALSAPPSPYSFPMEAPAPLALRALSKRSGPRSPTCGARKRPP